MVPKDELELAKSANKDASIDAGAASEYDRGSAGVKHENSHQQDLQKLRNDNNEPKSDA